MPSQRALVGLLGFRTAGFLAVQAVIALVLVAQGVGSAWTASAAWWPLTAMVTNLATVLLLAALLRAEGKRYRDLFQVDRATLRTDLLLLLALLVVAGPIGWFPNPALATLFWGDAMAGSRAMMQPLPSWGVWVAVVGFPATIVFAELPLYFGYVMPRLQVPAWAAVSACSFALALQHVTLPLLFDPLFFAWRLGMFLPFAFLFGVALRWRPTLLPWVCLGHGLIDLSAGAVVWQVSHGMRI